jgi:hypothetical protein
MTTRSKIYLPMVAMMVTAALAIPSAAQTQVPSRVLSTGRICQPPNHHYNRSGDRHAYRRILIDPTN